MVSNYSNIKKIRNKRTQILKLACGNKCIICGYTGIYQCLEFHHINEDTKNFSLANNTLRKWSELILEIKKCILVCANCHREIHYKPFLNIEIKKYYKIMKYDDILLNKCIDRNNIQKIEKICEICNKKFLAKRKNQKYCNATCSHLAFRKIKDRPPQYILRKLLKTETYTSLSKKYNVSPTAIKKWLK